VETWILEQLAGCEFCPSQIGLKDCSPSFICDVSCVDCWREALDEKEEE
jgi:hypothetical protein